MQSIILCVYLPIRLKIVGRVTHPIRFGALFGDIAYDEISALVSNHTCGFLMDWKCLMCI